MASRRRVLKGKSIFIGQNPSMSQSSSGGKDLLRAPKIAFVVILIVFFTALVKNAFSNYHTLQMSSSKNGNSKSLEFESADVASPDENDKKEEGEGGDIEENGEKDDEDVGEEEDETKAFSSTRIRRGDSSKDSEGSSSKTFAYDDEIELSSAIDTMVDLKIPLQPSDRAFFWHVPRSGGSTVKRIVAHCFTGLVTARQASAAEGDILKEPTLRIVTDLEGGKSVNVDTGNPDGISRAKSLGFATQPNVDLVVSPYLYQASEDLFSSEFHGRLFTMLRHPIDRAVSLFHFLREQPNAGIVDITMTLEEYAQSGSAENNWMTRFLSNKLQGELTHEDESRARKVLRTKCLIGLLKHKGESMYRFERYFGWKVDSVKAEECHGKLLDWKWPNKNKHPDADEDSRAWKYLKEHNTFDLRIYKYAEELFEQQAMLFPEVGLQ
eukprot:CAMPEP_0195287232 /NCGR_PEP_ID=MMETSP0707-20130614/4378_1 /TAXON_ID=33640 /ORGANISM="Asterionellopsis glacialis, Strain CCMP134" /LENGTH=437 /DNA_ID=CAMNT_0040346965 /DNA_START=100 /DNA_END=1413 /DNA_ORIENTATION=+